MEAKRDELHAKQSQLVDKASDDTAVLADKIQAKLTAAREQWSSLASPAHLNALIGEFVGPSLVTVEGRLVPVNATKNPVPAGGSAVHGVISGAGFEPPTSAL